MTALDEDALQPDRVRRIGVLMTLAADDPEGQARVTAFVQGLSSDIRNWPLSDMRT
jgi:hypothetical protein